MAQYQHLPIYKVTYELLQQITRITKDFPRDFKHSLAVKLRDEVARMNMPGREVRPGIWVGLNTQIPWDQVTIEGPVYIGPSWIGHGSRVRTDLTRVIL